MRDILHFITCGSVDDGKSTLIGKLLWESKQVFEGQLSLLEKDSARYGTQGEALDLALLVGGLQAEREQSITIDVAYRFFSTPRRRFVVADRCTRTKPPFGSAPPSAKRRRFRYRSSVHVDNLRFVQNCFRRKPLASNSLTNSWAASWLRHFLPNACSSLITASSANQQVRRKMGCSAAYRHSSWLSAALYFRPETTFSYPRRDQ